MTLSLKRIVPAVCLIAIGSFAVVAGAQNGPATQPSGSRTTTASGLTIIDQGRNDLSVEANDTVTVHYTGKLENGTVFDSSLTRGDPFKFQVGVSRVIKGWQEGLLGMKVGDRRQLIIPASLGYGDAGAPPTIPGGATLVFDIELLYISRPAK